ncbi:MAG: DNA methylase N-4 [Gammaproteobacteria bacterium]|nr:MAG: DNA methylase N-4 [Gammaproteobacteria bacterium]
MHALKSTFDTSVALEIKQIPLSQLNPLGRQIRKYDKRQSKKLQHSLKTYGCVLPIVVDQKSQVVGGWALASAAKALGWDALPCVRIDHLSEEQLRALRIALNRLGEESEWDLPALKLEITELISVDSQFDITFTGFEMGEVDVMLCDLDSDEESPPPVLDPQEPIVSRSNDLFMLGENRILCADARDKNNYHALLNGEPVQMVITDPPFNVPIRGHVSGNGRVQHKEFAMASGELSATEFLEFLLTVCRAMVEVSREGALHYLFMDWRHMHLLLNATQDIYASLHNLCVWVKSNGGMGSFYRSRHELVFVFKVGTSSHINNVELGRMGRYRTNVWEYAGCSSFGPDREALLALHPTVKPKQLVADAILDASNRGGAILDPFLGSGTTIIACEEIGRRGFGMELDPMYVDIAIQRWQEATQQDAIHESSGLAFHAIAQQRKENSDDNS